jgi:hypothetical protein
MELDTIAAVVIGGTLLTGGVGYICGTVFGVLVFGTIQYLIMFQGTLNSWWTRIVIGILILVFIVLQRVISKTSVSFAQSCDTITTDAEPKKIPPRPKPENERGFKIQLYDYGIIKRRGIQ